MATFTVRNVPDDAKHRFRQVAAAHGRSMEEHLRQLVIDADFGDAGAPTGRVAEAPQAFQSARPAPDAIRELLRAADGGDDDGSDRRRHAEIRFKSAKDAMAELRRLAGGVGFDPPPGLSTELDAPEF